MAWTVASFKARWPEFVPVADAQVQAELDVAALRVDSNAFKATTDQAVGLLAAHLLAMAPFGTSARIESKDGRTVYLDEYERLMRAKAGGPYAIGAWR